MELNPATTAFVASHWQNDVVGADGAFAPFFRAQIEKHGVIDVARACSSTVPAPLASRSPTPGWRSSPDTATWSPTFRCSASWPNRAACSTAPRAATSSTSSSPRPRIGTWPTPRSATSPRGRARRQAARSRHRPRSCSSVSPRTSRSNPPDAPPVTSATASSWSPTPAPLPTRPPRRLPGDVRPPRRGRLSRRRPRSPLTPHPPAPPDSTMTGVPMQDMLAARLHEIGEPMQLEQVPLPSPAPPTSSSRSWRATSCPT